MKVLILTQYFRPEFAVIPNELAVGLQNKGHEVRVLTGFPNYPYGKIFPGYRQKLRTKEVIEGIEVLRVPYLINRSRNPIFRMLSYISFGYSTYSAFKFAKDCDVIYVYATQMTAAIAPSLWNSRYKKIPFVLHIQDLWPESVTGSGIITNRFINNQVNKFLIPWIDSIYAKSSKLISIAPSMKKILLDRGQPEKKISTVYNWADESIFQNSVNNHVLVEQFARQSEKLRFVYAGNIGEMQNLDFVIYAISKLPLHSQIHLFIVGSGSKEPELKALVQRLKLNNVTFIGRVSPEEMKLVYINSDYQIITLKSLEIFKGTIPSKFQAALFSGVPVISIVEGDVNNIVEANGLGFSAKADDEGSVIIAFMSAINASRDFKEALSANASLFYENHMSSAISISKIESILKEVVLTEQGGI